ncbi:hypothetical protein SRHO_G00318670 [Serrasalmus rhombeus]
MAWPSTEMNTRNRGDGGAVCLLAVTSLGSSLCLHTPHKDSIPQTVEGEKGPRGLSSTLSSFFSQPKPQPQ